MPDFRRLFDVSAYEAKRLVVTETARIQTAVQQEMYAVNGVEEYEYIAEPSACDVCAKLDGKAFKVTEMVPGKNAAPMHPHCHCSTAPSVNEKRKELNDKLDEIWHSKYPHMDNVTNQYIDGKVYEPKISISSQIIKDGVTYVVDGHSVVSDHSNQEYQVAHWLSRKLGQRVDILPRVNIPENINTPDYLVGGIPYDLKAISGSGKSVIDRNLRKAKKQAPNIIFDITETVLSVSDVFKQLDHIYKVGRREIEIVIIKKDDEMISVLKPKK